MLLGIILDKGFNVKFKYKPKNNNRPNLAIGLDDFAGTGFFTREYIVATQDLRDIKVTAGLGWGKFAGENSFDNPLSFLSNKFNLRPSTQVTMIVEELHLMINGFEAMQHYLAV